MFFSSKYVPFFLPLVKIAELLTVRTKLNVVTLKTTKIWICGQSPPIFLVFSFLFCSPVDIRSNIHYIFLLHKRLYSVSEMRLYIRNIISQIFYVLSSPLEEDHVRRDSWGSCQCLIDGTHMIFSLDPWSQCSFSPSIQSSCYSGKGTYCDFFGLFLARLSHFWVIKLLINVINYIIKSIKYNYINTCQWHLLR